jgi:trimeric autotransporter adhesin
MKSNALSVLATIAGISLTLVTPAFAQGTAFTYQGQLQNNGSPASGAYNLTFSLFNINTGGVAIAGPITNNAVNVTNGLFTVLIDFGSGAFTGPTNWLEIGVETNGFTSTSFTTLAPRQQLTPTPYAIAAENATFLASGVAVGSGMGNLIAPDGTMDSFIGGGNANNILPGSLNSAVAGGQGNMIQPNAGFSFIGGGLNNQAASAWSVIGGGFANTASGLYATIGGGSNNVGSGYASTVGGGGPNYALGDFTFAGGGAGNTADGSYSTISGGQGNITRANFATVSGGFANIASGVYSVIGGGEHNTANNQEATVAGGSGNTASGIDSTVGGGDANTASGSYSTVPGGGFNVASGLGSFAAGYGADATNDNSFVWSDGEGGGFPEYFSDRANQFKIQAGGGIVMDVSGSSHVNPAALFINSTSATGVGLYVVQPTSTDAAVVINSFGAASSSTGGGDLIKGFGWNSTGFTYPNQLVFEVTVLGDVYANSFHSTSDRNAKDNFAAISPAEILQKVTSLPISQWNFKGEHQDVQHIGPMAQDFHAAFGLDGADDKHISLTDEGGVALAAIQGLNQKLEATQQAVKAKDGEIQTLKQQNDSLAERLNDLEAKMNQLAAQK